MVNMVAVLAIEHLWFFGQRHCLFLFKKRYYAKKQTAKALLLHKFLEIS
jgi:hypothetical protein